ncbi:hypothetical protein E4V42_13590 [Clostridium estertheticum]|uniref:Uncharacterized protein n=1 Tax=Clostridium estertheticum TaxID=238834 RepID=A0A5N7IQ87_9CLOT|nr:hypothetical protein [Clostridium estertheticum]MPQ32463.1 hypothetical protein [Clostridium estertheticum]MPQ63122.1 hypothetical protein [Clostridium estertheticum]
MLKLYKNFICGEEGWVTKIPQNFEDEIGEYAGYYNKNIDISKTIEEVEKLKVGEGYKIEELDFKCIEMSLVEYSNLGEWGG